MGVVVVVQAAVTLAVYRWWHRRRQPRPAPARATWSILLLASVVGAAVVIPLGPGCGPVGDERPLALFWWTALSTAYMFVGSACVMLLVARGPRSEAIPTRLIDVYVLLVVTALCLGVVFVFDEYPLTWLVLLPADLGRPDASGPWTAAAFSLTVALSVVVAQGIPAATRAPAGPTGSTWCCSTA